MLLPWIVACGAGDQQVKSVDHDGDGYTEETDCNDDDAAVHPDAAEVCDPYGVDEDCNGLSNNADAGSTGTVSYYRDGDGDGFGAAEDIQQTCTAPEGYTATAGDCDDLDPAINPNAREVCDEDDLDEDCDGASEDQDEDADPATRASFYADADGDGYGDEALATLACDAPPAYVAGAGDCDDARADVNPAATEVCDALDADEDCDGVADDLDDSAQYPNVFFTDADGDGFGSLSEPTYSCDAQPFTADNAEDCDDADAGINPGAQEACDPYDLDEDCDGLADDDDDGASGKTEWWPDADKDGYGSGSYGVSLCDNAGGYVDNGEDCDDTREDVSPSGRELCDEDDVDEDCDGAADDDDSSTDRGSMSSWFIDADGDGYGGASATSACDKPASATAGSDDCDDADPAVNPGAAEVCEDGVDNDCDGGAGGCGLEEALEVSDADFELYGESSGDGLADARGLGNMGDLDGDGTDDLVVGAYAASSARGQSGEVYVVYGPATGSRKAGLADWVLPGELELDWFGWSTASDGDLDGDGRDDLVVGAAQATLQAYGAVYVYDDPGDTSAATTLYGELSFSYFGYDVAIADVTGDGDGDLLSTAPGTGGVYVWKGPLSASGYELGDAWMTLEVDNLGDSLSTGDYDGDGIDDIAAGDPDGDDTSWAGKVVVWEGGVGGARSATDALLVASGENAGDWFGNSIALDEDWSGDGYADLAIGAPSYSESGVAYAGMVYLVYGPFSTNAQISAFANEFLWTGTPGDGFGVAVAYVGDVDHDGGPDLAASAYAGDGAAADAGVVYLLTGAGEGTADGTVTGVDRGEYCGWTLAGAGDFDGDGVDDLAVGSPLASVSATEDGAARVFLGGGL